MRIDAPTLPAPPNDTSANDVETSRCRGCGRVLGPVVIDLGMSPLCERILRADQLDEMEPFYPLRVSLCEVCGLLQLPAYVAPEEIFEEYGYFSSFSSSWLQHAQRFAEWAVASRGLSHDSLVVEVGSNDGYLLQHFLPHGIRVLGIDPAVNVAADCGRARRSHDHAFLRTITGR